jgi:hypothetical protein
MNKQPTYYSIHYNRPDFVEIQYKLSQILDYKLFIVNNGENELIKKKCRDLRIDNYIETKNIGTLSHSHANAINQILPLIDTSQPYGFIDHDIFIISKIYMINNDILSWKQENIPDQPYLWPGLLICKENTNLLGVNFLPGIAIKGDAGCDTYRVIKNYKVKWLEPSIDNATYINKSIQNTNEIMRFNIENRIVAYHYINGSNWAESNTNPTKNNILLTLLNNKFPGIFKVL